MIRIWLIANMASIICAGGAVAAILMRIDRGWGWLLFAAVCLHATTKSKSADDDDDDK